MEANESSSYHFDVALSFAGEDRSYVEQVATALKTTGIRVFYDQDYMADTWGEDLVEYFDEVYRLRSRFAILFLSSHYARKMWTRHERRSALARALEEQGAYVLPVRLDDTKFIGLPPSLGHLDARRVAVQDLVAAVVKKLDKQGLSSTASHLDRAPRTEAELAAVLRDRPRAWESLSFGGALYIELAQLEDQYLDYEMGYAERTGTHISRDKFVEWAVAAAGELEDLVDNLGVVLSRGVQERAYGASGDPGDPDRIRRMAHRSASIYKQVLDWAARVRGVTVPSELRDAVAALARVADRPLAQYRRLVKDYVARMDEVPAKVSRGETISSNMTIDFSVNQDDVDAFLAEMQKLNN